MRVINGVVILQTHCKILTQPEKEIVSSSAVDKNCSYMRQANPPVCISLMIYDVDRIGKIYGTVEN